MPRAKFRCKRCKRSFSMAAHLARHKSTIHASKKRKKSRSKTTKKAKRRTARPKVVRAVAASRTKTRRRRSSSIASGSDAIVNAMKTQHGELLAQRKSLDDHIDSIVRAMRALGATTTSSGRTPRAGKKRGRPVKAVGRPGSLKSYIVRVLRQTSKPMSLRDIGTRVKKAGFKTKSKDLAKAVSNALPGLKSVKRVGYGKYQMVG